jgi:Ca2+ transporting ATPase
MSTILQNITTNEYGHNKRLHTKGAAEIVLGLCSHYINEDGEKIELGEDMRGFLMGIIEEFATKALRTICLAYKDLKDGEGGATHEEEDEDKFNRVVEKNGLTCIGILGIRDIIRIEVPGAVETCQKAGIKVRMVTGDNKITAMAIARECNIVNEESTHEKDSVMEGSVFYERIGGLKCKKCDNISPCACAIKDVVEVV